MISWGEPLSGESADQSRTGAQPYVVHDTTSIARRAPGESDRAVIARALSRGGATVALFPGQGSHTSDMRDHVDRWCPELGEAAVEAVGDDPFRRVKDGTAFAQPAIFCSNVAGWRAIMQVMSPVAVAGHSLGEFAALVAAGAIDPLDALGLVVLRGRLMQEAEKQASGGMIAVSGPSFDGLSAIVERCGVVIANDNAPGQVVLSGSTASIEKALAQVTAAGLRAVRLPVGGAFHSPLMAGIREAFGQAIAELEFCQPKLLTLCTTTGAPFADIRQELTLGITRPVLWRQSIERLRNSGFRRFVEVGPGRVLSRLAKRTYGNAVDVVALDDVV